MVWLCLVKVFKRRKENPMPVKLDNGKHHHPIPKGLDKLIEEKLSSAGLPIELNWCVHFGASKKGTHHVSPFKVVALEKSVSAVKVATKVGNNTTAGICLIRPPSGSGITLEEIYDKLGGKDMPVNGHRVVVSRDNKKQKKEINKPPLDLLLSTEEVLSCGELELAMMALAEIFKGRVNETLPEGEVLSTIVRAYEGRVGKNSLPPENAKKILRFLIAGGHLVRAVKKKRPRYRLSPVGLDLISSKLESVTSEEIKEVVDETSLPSLQQEVMTETVVDEVDLAPSLAEIEASIKSEAKRLEALISQIEGEKAKLENKLRFLYKAVSLLEKASV